MLERSVTPESEEIVHGKVIQMSLSTLRTSFPGLGQNLGCAGVTTRCCALRGTAAWGTPRTQPVSAADHPLGMGCGAHWLSQWVVEGKTTISK